MCPSSANNASKYLIEKTRRQRAIAGQYRQILAKYPEGISLTELITLSGETDGFTPHYLADGVENRVEQFARKHNIWLEDRGEHYNTMTAYLHPSASDADRLSVIGMYYAILFYIDDMMGNEFRPNMTIAEREASDKAISSLFQFIKTGQVPEQPFILVPPTAEVLKGFRDLAPSEWLNHFLDYTRYHLEPAVRDLDSTALGRVYSIDEYVDVRNHVSGMYPAVLMMEFASENYLPRKELAEAGLLQSVERLEFLCAAIGGLVNDFFSYEKETLDASSDFNLIPLFMSNYGLDLEQAIFESAKYVNDLYAEYKMLAQSVSDRSEIYPWSGIINNHIRYMTESNMAVWVWQRYTQRYLRDESIFSELVRSNYRAST